MNALRLLWLSLILVGIGCTDEVEDRDIDYGYDYYPLEAGREWTYTYDSIVYQRQFNTVDTVSGFIRERLVPKAGDTTAYRLEREWRPTDTVDWKINSIWTVRREDDRLVRVEENLPFIKLVFPVREGLRWDGLGMLDRGISVSVAGDPIRIYTLWDDYRIEEVGESVTLGSLQFDDVVTVVENRTEDLGRLELRNSTVRYARGVGIISIEQDILECSDCSPSVPWEIKGDRGYRLRQTLISYR